MHSSKLLVATIAFFGIISCFTPWSEILFFGRAGKITGIHLSEGLFCLVYFALIAALCWISDHKINWSKKMAAGISIFSIVPAALTTSEIFSLKSQADKLQGFNIDINNYVIYNPAMGLYIALTAVGLIVCVALLAVLKQNKIRVVSAWPANPAPGRFFIGVYN